jgi:hypothetical protein
MEKEGVDFSEACRKLEKAFNLPYLNPDNYLEEEEPVVSIPDLDSGLTYSQLQDRVYKLLFSFSKERSCDLLKLASIWEIYDQIIWKYEHDLLKEKEAEVLLRKIRIKAFGLCQI